MNLARKILLNVLLVQFLIFLYVESVNRQPYDTQNIVQKTSPAQPKELPQSLLYTFWQDKKLQKEIIISQKEITKTSNPKNVKIAKIAKKSKKILSKIDKIAKYAKAKLGTKYVWGATGPKTFDCSGFTKEVFNSTVGIKIPRVSRDQAKVGKLIKYEELKAGDMVFFDTEKKFSGRVNHVGIYLDNGEFIHASSTRKKVIITNFKKKPFYKKRFLWGRRVVLTRS